MLTNNRWLENKIRRMLRQKRALYACEIVEDGFCVNQNAVKRNMEARNNYLFWKNRKKIFKKAGIRGRPSTTDSPSKEW